MNMNDLPIAPVDRLIRRAGADRVSEDAATTLSDILADFGTKVAIHATRLAKHAGRKTVIAEDIELAVRGV